MSKSKMSCTQSVIGVGIELSQTLVWTAKNYKYEVHCINLVKHLNFVWLW